MRVSAGRLFEAASGRFALGAYNVFNMEQLLGLLKGAAGAASPVLVQLSGAALRYAGIEMLRAMTEGAEKIYPEAVHAIHLDHGDEETCRAAIEAGFFSSVMIDASHEPFAANVAITRRVVDRAHAVGVWVEAELGTLAGVEDGVDVSDRDAFLTDPDAASTFVAETGCDALAVAVGNSHGAYKHASGGLRMDRLAEIHRRIPDTPLVLHGSSSVPRREVERINAAGGALGNETGGFSDEQVRETVGLGVVKINIATDARLIWTRVHREYFRDQPEKIDFCEPGRTFMDELARYVSARSTALGSAGKAALFAGPETAALPDSTRPGCGPMP